MLKPQETVVYDAEWGTYRRETIRVPELGAPERDENLMWLRNWMKRGKWNHCTLGPSLSCRLAFYEAQHG